MKSRLRWLLPLLALMVAAVVFGRIRSAKPENPAAAVAAVASAASGTAASAAMPALELAPQDLLTVQRLPLTRGLEVSGQSRAPRSFG